MVSRGARASRHGPRTCCSEGRGEDCHGCSPTASTAYDRCGAQLRASASTGQAQRPLAGIKRETTSSCSARGAGFGWARWSVVDINQHGVSMMHTSPQGQRGRLHAHARWLVATVKSHRFPIWRFYTL